MIKWNKRRKRLANEKYLTGRHKWPHYYSPVTATPTANNYLTTTHTVDESNSLSNETVARKNWEGERRKDEERDE